MGNRGRKSWADGGDGMMPLSEVAKRLGISARTAQADWTSAVSKLKRVPNAFELLLDYVHASAASDREVMRATSAECRPDFVNEWCGKRETR